VCGCSGGVGRNRIAETHPATSPKASLVVRSSTGVVDTLLHLVLNGRSRDKGKKGQKGEDLSEHCESW